MALESLVEGSVGEGLAAKVAREGALGRARRRRPAVGAGDDLRVFGRLDSTRVMELAHTVHEEAERHLHSLFTR
jgi:hypothetical protein